MAKSKAGGVQNRPLYSRASFLYQAASYLATAQHDIPSSCGAAELQAAALESTTQKPEGQRSHAVEVQGVSRRLVTDLREVTLKTMMRMSPAMKRTVCKFCDTLLVEGKTCTSVVENASRGGRKPWADVLVTKCSTCGRVKRFPVQASRQTRKTARLGAAKTADMSEP